MRVSTTAESEELSQRKAPNMAEQSASDSPPSSSMAEMKNTSQYVGFQIDDQQYAFRIEQIREIVILDKVTPRTIVVNVGERTMGCTVDMVSHVIRIPAENIQHAPETVTANGATYIAGFAKLDDRLVILLDIDELLNPEGLERIFRVAPTRNPK